MHWGLRGGGGGPATAAGSPALPSLPFLLRPFHVGPRAAGHVGGREPKPAWAQRPGVALAPSGPRLARGADLPPSRPRGSNFLLGPAPAASAFSGPRGQARAGHRGHLRSPNPDPGDGARALLERRRWLWVRGRGPVCWNLQRLCSLQEANIFYTLKKKMFLPVAWISLGLFLKPSFGWELPASRDGDKRRPGGPESKGSLGALGLRGSPTPRG